MMGTHLLKEKWKLWQECLNSKDTNSIFHQIYTLTWDAAIFRLIIECRRSQFTINPEIPDINPHLHNFIDRNFFQSQAACIRRLIEPSKKSSLYGKLGVYSLSALLKDMISARAILTREKYFEVRKLAYDYQEIIKNEDEYTATQIKHGNSSFWIPPEYDWHSSYDAHILFDKFSGVTNRGPDDTITINTFKKLMKKVQSFYTVTRYVDKRIAHSATPYSRNLEKMDEETVTWQQLWGAHQSLYEIAEFLSLLLVGTENVPLAIEPPTMFMHWDVPLISTNDVHFLKSAWNKYKEDTEEWRLNGVNRIWDYINSP